MTIRTKNATQRGITATQLSRRSVLKLTGAVTASTLLAACVPLTPIEPQSNSGQQTGGGLQLVDMPDFAGRVMMADRGPAKIHTYISPADANANATHIIESENSLVLVDGQMLIPFATEFRTYADSLGKPIEAIMLSHSHPDHHWGIAAAFEDVPVFALAETIAAIEAGGQATLESSKARMGDMIPDAVRVPENVAEPGQQIIDGLTYSLKHITDAEDTDQLVIELPELNTIIVQDLVYNGVHLFVAANRNSWASHVNDVKSMSQFTLGLAGHGMPFEGQATYDNVIGYLQTASELLDGAENAGAYIDGIAEAYPDYVGGLHELSASILLSGS